MEESNGGMVRWLSFRLRNGQSIGPQRLREAWTWACQSQRSGVRREQLGEDHWVYALYGPELITCPRTAEQRMRGFLLEAGYIFTMGSLGRREAA
ncbi:hypothetical protein [Stenotrophomonas sp. SPM]|uniref:hypothetical protein n=1 Tax=Stenotrophomonas sp. SPM TaxID=2170735 RepID=UPI001402AAF1|nr:hypothetical protein [Stenotrophomonas sp. SPM]